MLAEPGQLEWLQLEAVEREAIMEVETLITRPSQVMRAVEEVVVQTLGLVELPGQI
jgi:hypothetical protein